MGVIASGASQEVLVLGAALGLVALPLSVCLDVSPRWLRQLLIGCGALLALRYLVMALSLAGGDARAWWGVRSLCSVHLIGLTWPAVVAADQLIRNPAVTPKTLVRWYAPFLAISLFIMVFGHTGLMPAGGDEVRLALLGGWARLAGLLLGLFATALWAIGGAVWTRLPTGPVKAALTGLLGAYALVGLEGLVQATRPSPGPWMWPEMLALVALWAALRAGQRASS